MEIEERDLIDLIQCFYRVYEISDQSPYKNGKKIVDTIWKKYLPHTWDI